MISSRESSSPQTPQVIQLNEKGKYLMHPSATVAIPVIIND
jgi:hypothetical protein